MKSLVRDVMTTKVETVEPWAPFTETVTRDRAVHSVEGVIRVEDRLTFDVDDHDLGMPMTLPWMGPRALQQGDGIRR
jgi:hypothetical protein